MLFRSTPDAGRWVCCLSTLLVLASEPQAWQCHNHGLVCGRHRSGSGGGMSTAVILICRKTPSFDGVLCIEILSMTTVQFPKCELPRQSMLTSLVARLNSSNRPLLSWPRPRTGLRGNRSRGLHLATRENCRRRASDFRRTHFTSFNLQMVSEPAPILIIKAKYLINAVRNKGERRRNGM